MAIDAGDQVVFRVGLDASDLTKGANQISSSFDQINSKTTESSKALETYAQSLETVLAGAYKDMAKGSAQVVAAQQTYAAILESNKQKTQMYADEVSAASKKQQEAEQETIKLQERVAAAREQVIAQEQKYQQLREKEKTTQKTLQAAYEKLQRDIQVEAALREQLAEAEKREQEAADKTAKTKTQYADAITKAAQDEAKAQADIAKAEEQAATTIVKNTTQQLESINKIRQSNKESANERKKQVKEVGDAEKAANEDAKKSADELSKSQAMAFAVVTKAVDEAVEAIKKLTQEMVNLGKQIIETGASFEQSMAQVAATSGMTATEVQKGIGEYNALVESARTAGETTMFTATQAGEALNYLALAGYSVQESIDTMPDILTIAAAGAMDLGTASDMVTDAMNALELSVGETSDFIDKMAKTAQSSNTNVEQLGRAILTVGGTATVLKGGVAELDTALGLMANSGIKAQQGGTSLRQILLNLTDPTEKAAKKMEELGLQVFDAEGNMRSLQDIFSDLDTIMEDFSDQERMEALGEIFNARHIRAAVALMNSTGEAWDELANKIDNADGAASRMADTMMSTFNGAIITAKSTLESIQITLYEGVQKNLTSLVNEAIPKLRELNKELGSPEVQSRLESMSKQIKAIALDILDEIIKNLPKIIDFISHINTHLQNFITIAGTLIGLKLALEAEKVATALVSLFSVIAAHPVFALVAAVSALVVVVRELHAAAQAEHEATIAAIRAETDAYAEQRAEIEGTIDTWNDYKETADEVMNNATEQKDKVQALYEEYKRLYEAGEDTTLAMQALADEIPELKTMLADGKDSFEDITGAVNDYCDALIRSAQLEAGKEMYIEATKTANKLTLEVEDQKKAVEESQQAYEDAKKAREDYENTFGSNEFFMSASVKKEYQRLKNNEEALRNIYLENTATYGASSDALADALAKKAAAEEMYTASVKQESIDRGETYETELDARKATAEQYERDRKEEAEKLHGINQQSIDDMLADWADFDRQITVGDKTEDEKFDIIGQYFDTHPDWDKYNEELVKWYGNLKSFREKKNNEAIKQIETEQKERKAAQDKADKEAQDAADKADKAWTDRINKAIKKTEKRAKREEWDDSDLLAYYKKFLETNANYYETHLDEKEEFEEKIADLEDQINDKHIADSKTAAKKYVDTWTEGYDKLVDRATKAYSQLEKDVDNYQKSLLKGIDLISEETQKVWDVEKQAFVEKDVSVISTKALKEDLEQLKQFNAFVEKLRAQGADENLIDAVLGLSEDKRSDFMSQWNKMSTGEQAEYINTYKQIYAEADKATESYYNEALQKWQDEYWTPVQKYAETGGQELKEAMKTVGVDSVQSWLDGIQEKHDEATGQTKAMYEDVLKSAKDALGIASPSKEFYSIGEFSIQGFLDGLQSKIESITTIFTTLGQKAGDAFTAAFQSTWDSFVTLLNTTGGLQVPVAMTTTTFGTPTVQTSQVMYTGATSTDAYTGLTKADVVAAIKEAAPDGDITFNVDGVEFGRVARNSLNGLAKESGKMNLHV